MCNLKTGRKEVFCMAGSMAIGGYGMMGGYSMYGNTNATGFAIQGNAQSGGKTGAASANPDDQVKGTAVGQRKTCPANQIPGGIQIQLQRKCQCDGGLLGGFCIGIVDNLGEVLF